MTEEIKSPCGAFFCRPAEVVAPECFVTGINTSVDGMKACFFSRLFYLSGFVNATKVNFSPQDLCSEMLQLATDPDGIKISEWHLWPFLPGAFGVGVVCLIWVHPVRM